MICGRRQRRFGLVDSLRFLWPTIKLRLLSTTMGVTANDTCTFFVALRAILQTLCSNTATSQPNIHSSRLPGSANHRLSLCWMLACHAKVSQRRPLTKRFILVFHPPHFKKKLPYCDLSIPSASVCPAHFLIDRYVLGRSSPVSVVPRLYRLFYHSPRRCRYSATSPNLTFLQTVMLALTIPSAAVMLPLLSQLLHRITSKPWLACHLSTVASTWLCPGSLKSSRKLSALS